MLNDLKLNANNEWLTRFKARHNITWSKHCGEAISVDQNIAQNYIKNIPQLTSKYELENILNGDKSGDEIGQSILTICIINFFYGKAGRKYMIVLIDVLSDNF